MLVPLTDRSNRYAGMMLELIADQKARAHAAASPSPRSRRVARKRRA